MTGRSVAGWLGLPQPASFYLGSLTCCVEGGMGEKRGGMSEKKDVFSCVIGWNLVTLKEKTE